MKQKLLWAGIAVVLLAIIHSDPEGSGHFVRGVVGSVFSFVGAMLT